MCRQICQGEMNNVYIFVCFVAVYAVLLQNLSFMRFTLFCREICFVAIHALWRREKLSKKFTCGEKRTNMKYAEKLSYQSRLTGKEQTREEWRVGGQRSNLNFYQVKANPGSDLDLDLHVGIKTFVETFS